MKLVTLETIKGRSAIDENGNTLTIIGNLKYIKGGTYWSDGKTVGGWIPSIPQNNTYTPSPSYFYYTDIKECWAIYTDSGRADLTDNNGIYAVITNKTLDNILIKNSINDDWKNPLNNDTQGGNNAAAPLFPFDVFIDERGNIIALSADENKNLVSCENYEGATYPSLIAYNTIYVQEPHKNVKFSKNKKIVTNVILDITTNGAESGFINISDSSLGGIIESDLNFILNATKKTAQTGQSAAITISGIDTSDITQEFGNIKIKGSMMTQDGVYLWIETFASCTGNNQFLVSITKNKTTYYDTYSIREVEKTSKEGTTKNTYKNMYPDGEKWYVFVKGDRDTDYKNNIYIDVEEFEELNKKLKEESKGKPYTIDYYTVKSKCKYLTYNEYKSYQERQKDKNVFAVCIPNTVETNTDYYYRGYYLSGAISKDILLHCGFDGATKDKTIMSNFYYTSSTDKEATRIPSTYSPATEKTIKYNDNVDIIYNFHSLDKNTQIIIHKKYNDGESEDIKNVYYFKGLCFIKSIQYDNNNDCNIIVFMDNSFNKRIALLYDNGEIIEISEATTQAWQPLNTMMYSVNYYDFLYYKEPRYTVGDAANINKYLQNFSFNTYILPTQQDIFSI